MERVTEVLAGFIRTVDEAAQSRRRSGHRRHAGEGRAIDVIGGILEAAPAAARIAHHVSAAWTCALVTTNPTVPARLLDATNPKVGGAGQLREQDRRLGPVVDLFGADRRILRRTARADQQAAAFFRFAAQFAVGGRDTAVVRVDGPVIARTRAADEAELARLVALPALGLLPEGVGITWSRRAGKCRDHGGQRPLGGARIVTGAGRTVAARVLERIGHVAHPRRKQRRIVADRLIDGGGLHVRQDELPPGVQVPVVVTARDAALAVSARVAAADALKNHHVAGRERLVHVHVVVAGQRNLLHVVAALRAPGRLPGRLHRGQQKRNQGRDGRDQ